MATTAVQRTAGGSAAGPGQALYDILDLILDKGLVIDVFARVSLVGIELLTIDVRVVIASVDTYLRFAEAANRLDLETPRKGGGLTGLTDGLAGATGAVGGLGGAGALTAGQGALSGIGGAPLQGATQAVGGAGDGASASTPDNPS